MTTVRIPPSEGDQQSEGGNKCMTTILDSQGEGKGGEERSEGWKDGARL